METSGRERRHRYFTVASYKKLVVKENLDKTTAGYADIDFTNVGGFLEVDPQYFYSDQDALYKYQDDFKDKTKVKSAKARKHPLKNPVLPDGTVKQGRPRKHPVGEDPIARREANKRKRDQEAANDGRTSGAEQGQPTKKRRLEEGVEGLCASPPSSSQQLIDWNSWAQKTRPSPQTYAREGKEDPQEARSSAEGKARLTAEAPFQNQT